MTEGGGDRGGPWSPPPKKKKKEKTNRSKKNVKFGSNFSHSATSKKKFGPIFRFYNHIQ
jgi:hypothetical protein